MSTNMELITSVTVGSGGAASVTLPATGSIAATYTDLKISISARSSNASDNDAINLYFNADTTSGNYSCIAVYGTGSSASAYSTTRRFGSISAGNNTASTFGNLDLYIPNYTSSNQKSYSSDSVTENNATTAYTELVAGKWTGTAAITSVTFSLGSGNFVEGSTFYLYGISKVTSTPKATGGIVSQDATYWYHTFPFSSTFTATANLTADYLVVAGGGGGGFGDGGYVGGGGGAGGLRCTVTASGGSPGTVESALSLTNGTSYTVTVGGGGARGASSGTSGTQGGNSVFSTITSTGGGGGGFGGSGSSSSGTTGGSGGGGGGTNTSGSTAGSNGTTNQGFAGGSGRNRDGDSANLNGGGGGGAGVAGTNGGNNTLGAGGNGVATSISGLSVTYAGGGGGGSNDFDGRASGGTGGGGAGATATGGNIAASAGTINSGGGGGGGQNGGSSAISAAGGSGLVIIRYAK